MLFDLVVVKCIPVSAGFNAVVVFQRSGCGTPRSHAERCRRWPIVAIDHVAADSRVVGIMPKCDLASSMAVGKFVAIPRQQIAVYHLRIAVQRNASGTRKRHCVVVRTRVLAEIHGGEAGRAGRAALPEVRERYARSRASDGRSP